MSKRIAVIGGASLINRFVKTKFPDPTKLFFCFHRIDDTMFIHANPNGTFQLKKGFENAAYFDEKNTEKLLREHSVLNCITVAEMSKVLPVFLNFPAGHPLADFQIEIVNGEVDYNPKIDIVKSKLNIVK